MISFGNENVEFRSRHFAFRGAALQSRRSLRAFHSNQQVYKFLWHYVAYLRASDPLLQQRIQKGRLRKWIRKVSIGPAYKHDLFIWRFACCSYFKYFTAYKAILYSAR
jgi:hypothetical protein